VKKFCTLVLLAACSQPQAHVRPPEHLVDFAANELWQAQWQKNLSNQKEILRLARWGQSSSIEGERYWQNQQLAEGRRGFLQLEAKLRAETEPDNPDFQYLYARLLQDPVALQIQFEVLALRWPKHAWIRLGAAGSNQNIGNWKRARYHLKSTQDWPDAREFRHLLEAQQAEFEGSRTAWAVLVDDAFLHGSPAALKEFRRLAIRAQNQSLVRRADAEIALRQATPSEFSETERLDFLLERGLAELTSDPQLTLAELTEKLDAWSEPLQLPALWQQAKVYQLPLNVGQLLAPERDQGRWAEWLARQRVLVMLGSSVGSPPNMLVLKGVQRHSVSWPGLDRPLEIAVCESGRGSAKGWVSGGALFRGFYVRKDLSHRLAQSLQSGVEKLDSKVLSEFDQLSEQAADFGPAGSLPESQDLPLRLRAALLLADSVSAEAWEWRALYLHEAGHLPDIVPWTEGNGRLLQALWWAFSSWVQDGMVLGEWEYRAQLRALASGEAVVWNLANLVETAQRPNFPYFKPYRRLLTDLVVQARAMGYPELPQWHRLEAAQIADLAQNLGRKINLELLPDAVVSELIEQLDIAK
jgi:hypothetical protein